MADEEKKEEQTPAEAPPKKGGLMQDWMPLLLMMVMMPVVAYVMTSFVLIPQMEAKARTIDGNTNADGSALTVEGDTNGGGDAKKEDGKVSKAPPLTYKAKFSPMFVSLRSEKGMKVLAEFTVVSDVKQFPRMIKAEKNLLEEEAHIILESLTIKQMEAPNSRSVLKTNLINGFNAVLQTNVVKGLYFTDLAVQ